MTSSTIIRLSVLCWWKSSILLLVLLTLLGATNDGGYVEARANAVVAVATEVNGNGTDHDFALNDPSSPLTSPPPQQHYNNPMIQYNWKVVGIISHYTGGLSAFGSLWILYDVLSTKPKRSLPYYRIMLGLSFYDLCSSILYFLGDWVLHHDNDNITGMCVATGFFTYLSSLCVPMYNAVLAIYFYMSVCCSRSWSTQRISQKFERYVHPTIATIGITTSIIGIYPLKLYNPSYKFCSPFNNSRSSGSDRPFIIAADIYFLMYIIAVVVSALFVTVIMVLMYCNVSNVLARGQQHSFESYESGSNDFGATDVASTTKSYTNRDQEEEKSGSSIGFGTAPTRRFCVRFASFTQPQEVRGAPPPPQPRNARQQRSSLRIAQRRNSASATIRAAIGRGVDNALAKQVRTMSLLYMIPFYITWVVPTIFFSIQMLSSRDMIPLQIQPQTTFRMQVYVSTALPLQGFLNWFVYMYPRFRKIRTRHPTWNLLKVISKLLSRTCTRRSHPHHHRRHRHHHPKTQTKSDNKTNNVVEVNNVDDNDDDGELLCDLSSDYESMEMGTNEDGTKGENSDSKQEDMDEDD